MPSTTTLAGPATRAAQRPAADGVSLDQHWMPFTANRDFKRDPKMVVRAEGVHYYDPAGRPVLDGCSGLFTTPAGHGRREIADAVHRQLLELDYTSSFTRGHPGAFALAERLSRLLPRGLDRVFFVNSGSEAVDTAMKIALAYHRASGQGQRTLFVSRERAYHGVNFGGVALSGMVRNRQTFGFGLPAAVHMRHTWLPETRFVKGMPPVGAELAEDLQRAVALYGADTIAACVVEPIAGSTGVLVPPRGYLERLREICDAHGILLVFDEVICGFGRTGKPFAADSFGVVPDVITMAKAITNGAQPMGAVAVRRAIHDTIVEAAADDGVEFFHGYTWSAHPAACAASLAALDLYERGGLFEQGARLSPAFLEMLFGLGDLPLVTDIRGYGLLGGIDLAVKDGKPGLRGHRVQKALFDAGLHVKATGDCLILAPAFVMTEAEVERMGTLLRRVLGEAS
ncbi:aminotransferase class III-fold pyridoxal phosphate-dependent enzyme [Azospirillum sp. ST 5-10]|uniref:aminotransferase class III-fold pyridoxal phosphate-dependent enzyme n=1 Tax=unclassified Azospirillum TaxID=2630922 RepID=UPI003F4A1805